MFKKNLTPQERFDKAEKTADKALRKRDKLGNDPLSEMKRKELNRTIAKAIEQKEIAKYQMKHPAPVPKIQDNSRRTTIEVNVKSKNSKEIGSRNSFKKK